MKTLTFIFKLTVAITLAVAVFTNQTHAQSGVSINDAGTAPDADAILDISSSDKGVLLPRVADHTTLTPNVGGDFGLVVFNTTTSSYWYWDGTTWEEIPTVASTGNTLDEAYDEGGAGAGRTIVATDGAVQVAGADGFLVTGTFGSGDDIAVSGAGVRMFFNPKKGAFRAGSVNSTQWDNANVGDNSVALGSETTASGSASFAAGWASTASSWNAVALGAASTASGGASFAVGGATASGNGSVGVGSNSLSSGYQSTAIGSYVTASGQEARGLGANIDARSGYEIVVGRYNTAYTPNSIGGWDAADRLFTVANGTGTGSNSSNALTILKNGNVGVGASTPSEKLEIEFNNRGGILLDGNDNDDAFIQIENGGGSHYIFDDDSDAHKLKIESATGREIVFNTDGANERMAIQADGRVRVGNLADPSSALVFSNPAGILSTIALTGNTTDVLLGDGTFGSSTSFSDHDWYQALSTNIPTGINDWIYTNGHVGIGIGSGTNPNAPLHVAAAGAGNPDANSILAYNSANSVSQDAIITARVGGSNAGDPFFSLDIANEFGWSLGVDNSDANRFKIAPSWSNLSSSTALTIQTDGKVGIGTTGPSEGLTINGSNNDTYSAIGLRSGNNNNGFNNGAQIAFGYNGSATYQHFIQTRHNSGSSENAIDFYVSNGTQNNTLTSGSTHVMSLESGNVGIGKTSPASILDISTSQTGNVVKLHNPSLSNGSLVGHEFGKNNNTNNMAEFRYNHISDGNSGNWINLGLWGSANTLNVVGTGNVGIGTAGPAQKLEVAGNTRITGLSGGGDRVVYANNNGDLYASTGIPSGDTDYIWNQNGSAQGANWRISGQGEANTLVANANGNWFLRGGDDHELRDVNEANTLGVWGRQNSSVGRIKLGSGNNIIRSTDDQTGDYGGAAGFDFDSGTSPQGILIEGGDSESGGFFANGNTAAIWSPGDGTGGILSVYDEDAMDINNPSMRVNGSGVVEARRGMRSERQIRFYKRSRWNGQGGTDNLGNYDFCYLSGVAFRNTDSNIDEDDDYQCNVYTQDINGSADANEGENEDYTGNFSYDTRPYWRLYSECYSDCSNATCTVMCINFDF